VKNFTRILKSLVRATALICCCAALAHDGPEHEVEELTERIKQEGESADLLLQRAIEYQVMRKPAEAVKDLQRALHFEPDSPAIQRELGRAYFSTGKTNEALKVVTRGLEGSVEGADRASLLMVRAEILRPRKEYEKALDDTNEAIREHPNNVEWYLTRSELQYILKLPKERVAGLEQGIKITGSGVLQAAWIDALIDDKRFPEAMAKIEAEMTASRLQSSWLLRRARIFLATEKKEAAKTDLEAALKELNRRISSSAPDGSLLADRGLAHELLGDKDNARKDYTAARDKGVADEWLRERIRVLGRK
jgi:tetratricopeptide (TPR) repeat protein